MGSVRAMARWLPVLALPGLALAQEDATAWLASEAAATFRQRVVDLAVLYDESAGIDPQGYKVEARRIATRPDGCQEVEAVTRRGERELRRETVLACKRKP